MSQLPPSVYLYWLEKRVNDLNNFRPVTPATPTPKEEEVIDTLYTLAELHFGIDFESEDVVYYHSTQRSIDGLHVIIVKTKSGKKLPSSLATFSRNKLTLYTDKKKIGWY